MTKKIILVGYPGSSRVLPASKYLASKYLDGFDITYLNYKGDTNKWADYVANFLEYLTDERIVLALDDYLISGPIDMDIFREADEAIGGAIINVKLCECSEEDQEDYPCTTQFTIWDREFLITLLRKVSSPWEFEVKGSKILKHVGAYTLVRSCIPYYTSSSLSSKWEGVRLDELNQEDINYIKANGLIS